MKALFLPIIGVAIFITFVGLLTQRLKTQPLSRNFTATATPISSKEIKIGGVTLNVEIADTPDARRKGLSGRDRLDENSGMLFVFPKASFPTFWMKGMKLALDFIWIKDAKVAKIEKNIPAPAPGTPDNELTLYYPDSPIDYVLEVNGGLSDKNNVKVGDPVTLPAP